jgi:hypothetical protein
MRQKGISNNMAECIKKMYNGIKFCVMCGDEVRFLLNEKEVKDKVSVSAFICLTFLVK